ncbi:DUF551 domain-containing protein [Bacteroides caccae]|jgi:hypothetical protein|uniref:DUF551 domain-containing protein n=1 Tax=Bacteroides caccae TaxID=47678 RepID=UPI001F3CE94B|nr:DUF551 domain-containing protein [Bacteroides caccae]MCE8774407.1 DUF551 domain-containing protein [Bacteroides caccae]
MKQIEKAAEKYALECQKEEGYPSPMYDSCDAKDMRECAFKSGAEWQAKQSPWISVEDRLPEGNTGVFFTVEWNDIYKVGYFVGLYYEDGQWESERRIFLPNSSLVRVTHWMPIPSFDEILEANRDVLERIKEKGD